ncbi:hypothetical protein NMG60_11027074 [Bertholletia excelsa]
MGGCCCGASKEVELNNSLSPHHSVRVSEENEPLASHHGTVSALSTGLSVDTNLETSIPDTCTEPPAPLPYSANLSRPQTPPRNDESCGYKKDAAEQNTNTEPIEQTNAGHALETSDKELKKSSQEDTELSLLKDSEVEDDKFDEVTKSSEPPVSKMDQEEDVCPICLEEYDAENPKIITKCEHHFHLACILEWMERSEACPVCDKDMIINTAV